MRVLVTGGTGLIGRRLVRRILESGGRPVVVSRRERSSQDFEVVQGDPTVPGPWQSAVDGCDAVVNLVGHNVFAGRWTPEVKRKIRDSRIDSTNNLVSAIAVATARPGVLVQASAVGYYGPTGDEELDESAPAGTDFLASVCRDWEAASSAVDPLGVRRAVVRIGIVLAPDDGALKIMTPLFKLGPGVPIGGDGGFTPARGRQWMSWIHADDIVGILHAALTDPAASGPINGVAPNPVRNADFARALSNALWKPYAPWRVFLPFGPPDAILRLVLGESAEAITRGQRVVPRRALELGYRFQRPDLAGAFDAVFRSGVESAAS